MADDKTTKTPEQPVTDSGPGKETPPAPPKRAGGSEKSGGKTQRAGTAEAPEPSPESR